jgi:hypothetical protein
MTSTQQIEWEFSLLVPRDNNPVSVGNKIELRMQHDDGTELSAYTLPQVTIGTASAGFSGTLSGGTMN